jgi:hypothetical protein
VVEKEEGSGYISKSIKIFNGSRTGKPKSNLSELFQNLYSHSFGVPVCIMNIFLVAPYYCITGAGSFLKGTVEPV